MQLGGKVLLRKSLRLKLPRLHNMTPRLPQSPLRRHWQDERVSGYLFTRRSLLPRLLWKTMKLKAVIPGTRQGEKGAKTDPVNLTYGKTRATKMKSTVGHGNCSVEWVKKAKERRSYSLSLTPEGSPIYHCTHPFSKSLLIFGD